MEKIRTPLYRTLLTLGVAVVYHWFFWEEQLGINLALFSGLLLSLAFVLYPSARSSRPVQILAAGVILTGGLVLIYHSTLAIIAHFVSLFVWIGLVQLPDLQSLGYGLQSSLTSFFRVGRSVRTQWKEHSGESVTLGRWASYLKLTLVPLAMVSLFAFLFYFANAAFADLLDQLGASIGTSLGKVSWGSLFFFLSGLWLVAGLVFAHGADWLQEREGKLSNQLLRRPSGRIIPKNFGLLDLKKEFRTGILAIGMINLLLLLNNVLDVKYVWLAAETQAPGILRQYVHEGTYLLIASILLSIAIMLTFFRGNLNFYPNNRLLRYLSYAWIVQNGFLLLSVGVRNYHFISQYALAYKRIGVFFFLMLTLFGLFTLGIKIRDRMSGFYLWKANAWAVYGGMLLFALVNWDMLIVKHNLNHHAQGKELDLPFVLELSDHTLPILLENQAHFTPEQISKLERRAIAYFSDESEASWKGWNWADHHTTMQIQAILPAAMLRDGWNEPIEETVDDAQATEEPEAEVSRE